jgi:hypothetical protein
MRVASSNVPVGTTRDNRKHGSGEGLKQAVLRKASRLKTLYATPPKRG